MEVRAKPIVHREAYNRPIAGELQEWFAQALFAPLQIVLEDHGVRLDPAFQAIKYDEFGRVNVKTDALERAIRAGNVQYAEGRFTGTFSSAITRELRGMGAVFDPGSRTFKLPSAQAPQELRTLLAAAAENSEAVNREVLRALDSAAENISSGALGLNFARAVDAIVGDLGRQFVTTVSAVSPGTVGITPTLEAGIRAELDRTLTNNLDLAIKDFAAERIPELRRRVEENAFRHGGRTDRLAKIIESEFGVDRRKAEFLADQETGLLVSKYRAERYKEVGVRDYTWSTSHDNRVRDSHRRLEGKRFSFSTGANVSEPREPARYLNPGEDWRCRCVPIPIMNFAEAAA